MYLDFEYVKYIVLFFLCLKETNLIEHLFFKALLLYPYYTHGILSYD